MSTYAFQASDPARAPSASSRSTRRSAPGCSAQGLPLPAYDSALKCSHTFNLLDARGAISVTERAGFIKRVRDNARACAEAYLEVRAELGFPLRKTAGPSASSRPLLEGAPRPASSWDVVPGGAEAVSEDLLFEIGTEELPAGAVEPAVGAAPDARPLGPRRRRGSPTGPRAPSPRRAGSRCWWRRWRTGAPTPPGRRSAPR